MKVYRIYNLLSAVKGAKSEFMRALGIKQLPNSLSNLEIAMSLKTKISFTKAFNEIFETNYKRSELFEIEDKK